MFALINYPCNTWMHVFLAKLLHTLIFINAAHRSELPAVKKRRVAQKRNECPICCSGDTVKAAIWYGCNFCPTWFHRECLPVENRATADLSVMHNTDYKCYLCVRKALMKAALCVVCYKSEHCFLSKWFKCSYCERCYHSSCLSDDQWIAAQDSILTDNWKCPSCLVND